MHLILFNELFSVMWFKLYVLFISSETTTVAGSPYLIEQDKAQELCQKVRKFCGFVCPLFAHLDR